jgi:D-alanyl-D-alanine carboxypeptidase/D-alanyl-D-alanine-endopeptidase (penicillin-binding protein 4)
MAEIIQGILEPSQNWMTEQLVRTLGSELRGEGSWSEGFRVQREFLTGYVGVDSLDLTFRDGSGLSAYNLVTPSALVRTLHFMRNTSGGARYRSALAKPGEDSGTLRSRLQELEGRVFAKTGTITHVNSLSGYLVTASGSEIIFSILSNNSGLPSAQVRAGIDLVVQTIARR